MELGQEEEGLLLEAMEPPGVCYGSSTKARFTEGHLLLLISGYIVSDSVTPWTVVHQAPLSMGFPRQEYWSGFPCPPSGDLPNPGIEPASPEFPALAGGFFTTEPPGKPSSRHEGILSGMCKNLYESWSPCFTQMSDRVNLQQEKLTDDLQTDFSLVIKGTGGTSLAVQWLRL